MRGISVIQFKVIFGDTFVFITLCEISKFAIFVILNTDVYEYFLKNLCVCL
jgi:hypothetical protein